MSQTYTLSYQDSMSHQWYILGTYPSYEEAEAARMEQILRSDRNWSFAPRMQIDKDK